jgi:hypothetical protein
VSFAIQQSNVAAAGAAASLSATAGSNVPAGTLVIAAGVWGTASACTFAASDTGGSSGNTWTVIPTTAGYIGSASLRTVGLAYTIVTHPGTLDVTLSSGVSASAGLDVTYWSFAGSTLTVTSATASITSGGTIATSALTWTAGLNAMIFSAVGGHATYTVGTGFTSIQQSFIYDAYWINDTSGSQAATASFSALSAAMIGACFAEVATFTLSPPRVTANHRQLYWN